MYDELIHAHFPHRDERGRPSYRPYQYEVIRDTLDAFDDDSVTDVVVEAPTGAGKTSIAVTVARVMTHDFPRALARARCTDNDQAAFEIMAPFQAHLITSMKMLQDAYLGDDPDIKIVKGKSNYVCDRDSGQKTMDGIQQLSCDDVEQMYGRLCEHGCPYKQARKSAQWAPIALHNFDGFLNQASLGQAFGPRRLLTLDEAHNSEEKLRNFMTIVMDQAMFEDLGLRWTEPHNVKDMNFVIEWARGRLYDVKSMNEAMESELVVLRNGRQSPREIQRMAHIVRFRRRTSMIEQRLDRFLTSSTFKRPVQWVAHMDEGKMHLEPVDAGRFVPIALLRFGDKRLHLSATFLNRDGDYTRAVCLKRAKHISVPSTFPLENRRIVVKQAGNLKMALWNTNLVNVIGRVKEILTENKSVRGVIHCTSYNMSKDLESRLRDPRLLFYDRETRDGVVNDFIAGRTDKNAVLVAVALREGYDFKDDLCRFQIIVRVPFPVNNKKGWMQARMDKDRPFYSWRTALALVQTYGRGVRSSSDWCQTYVLDQRFHSFVNAQKNLPGWFLEAISS
jgi:ATP-dependent DNA helicase DinG